MKIVSTVTIISLVVTHATAKLVLPSQPPMGVNSFDLQYDRKNNPNVPLWNESTFRAVATAMADQLLQHGYDTMVIDGGWAGDNVDQYGRPNPDPTFWPSSTGGRGFGPLAQWTHDLGLKFGVWTLRGVDPVAVERKLPVLGADPPVTIDQIVYDRATCHAGASVDPVTLRWCNCTWDSQGIGVNASHPAAQNYYDSVVDLYSSWGVDFIKWDCMYDDGMTVASYATEEILAANAVRKVSRPIILSLSPGGGMTDDAAAWVAGFPDGQAPTPGAVAPTGELQASMYRVTGDFHSRPLRWIDGLGEHVFVVGNLSVRGLFGANNTWPDLDILDLGKWSGYFKTPTAQLHAVMWMMARSPLMYGGALPIEDTETLRLITEPLALMVNHYSQNLSVAYSGDCRCTMKRDHGHACRPINDPTTANDPCVVTWWADMHTCKAVAVLNIGNFSVAHKTVHFDQIGIERAATSDVQYNVTHVYEGFSETAEGSVTVSVEPMGGTLLIVAPYGTSANDCVTEI